MSKKLLYPFLGCIVAVVFAEIVVRLFVTSPSAQIYDEELGYWYRANSRVMVAAEGGAYLSVNSNGLLDNEVNLAASKKIVVVGDSIAESKQVPRFQAFHSLIEKNNPEWDVINAGFASFGPSHYPLVVKRVREVTDLDLVVLFLHTGEIQSIVLNSTQKKYNKDGVLVDILPKLSSGDKIKKLMDPLISRSALVTQLMRKLKSASKNVEFLPNWMTIKPKSDVSTQLSESLESKIQRNGRDYMALLFERLKQESHAPVIIIYYDALNYLSNKAVSSASTLGELEVFRDAAARQNIPFYDFTERLESAYIVHGAPPIGFSNKMPGVGHLNPLGHEVVASVLTPIIEEKLLIEKRNKSVGEP